MSCFFRTIFFTPILTKKNVAARHRSTYCSGCWGSPGARSVTQPKRKTSCRRRSAGRAIDLDELEDVKGWLAVVVPTPLSRSSPLRALPPRVGDARIVARGRHLTPAGAGGRPSRSDHARRSGAARTRGRARPTLARRTRGCRPR